MDKLSRTATITLIAVATLMIGVAASMTRDYIDWKKSIYVVEDVGVFTEKDVAMMVEQSGEQTPGAQAAPGMFHLLGSRTGLPEGGGRRRCFIAIRYE